MKKVIVLCIVIILTAGCSKSSTTQKHLPSDEADPTIQAMPDDMPNDFGFSVSFGVGKKNEVNCYLIFNYFH